MAASQLWLAIPMEALQISSPRMQASKHYALSSCRTEQWQVSLQRETFTSLGGLETIALALINPNTSAVTQLPGLMTFLEEVNAYRTDNTLFTRDAKPLTVHGRFGDYTIDTFRLTKCQPTTLSNVVAKLKKFDSDVEIPSNLEDLLRQLC